MPSYPNRCQHIKINGTQCGSPALRRNRFCYFHKRHHDERVALHLDQAKGDRAADDRRRRRIMVDLPILEDANSIQISLMQIMRLVVSGHIDGKTAGLLLYALQTASANLPRTTFEPRMHEVVLDPRYVDETSLGMSVWEDSDFYDEDDLDDDPEADPARHAGIVKAAEYLYELDRKRGGVDGFAAKTSPTPPLRAAEKCVEPKENRYPRHEKKSTRARVEHSRGPRTDSPAGHRCRTRTPRC
jgi:hypothetical protein